MRRAGLPVRLIDSDSLVARLQETDMIGIVSEWEHPWYRATIEGVYVQDVVQLIAIFKNKANSRRNGNQPEQSERRNCLKSTSYRVRKSIQGPCLEFTKERLHLRPKFFNWIYRKALCQFLYADALIVSFQNQLSSFVVQYSTHLL